MRIKNTKKIKKKQQIYIYNLLYTNMLIQPKKCQKFLLAYFFFRNFLYFLKFWNFFVYHKMIQNDIRKSSKKFFFLSMQIIITVCHNII